MTEEKRPETNTKASVRRQTDHHVTTQARSPKKSIACGKQQGKSLTFRSTSKCLTVLCREASTVSISMSSLTSLNTNLIASQIRKISKVTYWTKNYRSLKCGPGARPSRQVITTLTLLNKACYSIGPSSTVNASSTTSVKCSRALNTLSSMMFP